MGQRLNLEIRKKNKVLANSYYHWSAYTGSAYEIAKIAIGYIQDHKDETDSRLLAIRALEETGAGCEEDDINFLKDLNIKYSQLDFKKCVSRNEGILSVSPSTIKSTQDWAEGTCVLEIEDPTDIRINFDVLGFWDSKEYYETECDLTDEEKKSFEANLVSDSFDLNNLSIADFDDLIKLIMEGKYIELPDKTILCELG